MTTPYHARYFAHDLRRQAPANDTERLSLSLFDASVDLNPHQIEAALFALRSPLSKGAILADEVGLGKTIEAGLVLCQFWAEKKRRLLIICPASIRKQWALELSEKFNLHCIILDAASCRERKRAGNPSPFQQTALVVTSMHFASKMREEIRCIPWDLVIIDEAHKLRNAYRPSNRMGQALRWALADRFKLLLTATPLQNSLLELYGFSTLLDEHIFGEIASFRNKYLNQNGDIPELRERLKCVCKRTLRRDVLEYIRYTERKPIGFRFRASDEEHKLYNAVSAFLQRDQAYSLPQSQRQLVTLVLRKLLASSSSALAGALETLRDRLLRLKQGLKDTNDIAASLVQGEEIESEIIDESEDYSEDRENEYSAAHAIDPAKLDVELAELERFIAWAKSIGVDTKTRTLLTALETGFAAMQEMRAARKALIFTESRKTQDYLFSFLEANGYAERVVLFNGTNSSPNTKRVYDAWLLVNRDTGRATGSRDMDARTALIDHFRDNAEIMIATEAAAEGVNLQFCSLVINYDLPWNPQRIEQRIGRCHRYGQTHDVVVINFLNERNEADRRVFELLTEKFQLFNGVFGASDEVLGAIESGVDFENRILAIYQTCRTPEEIDKAFATLQRELESTIELRMEWAKRQLLETFDEDVHTRLKVRLDDARAQLDKVGARFWELSRYILANHARFDDTDYSFELLYAPQESLRTGRYHLVSKERENVAGDFLYRLTHPLGEYVIDRGRACYTPEATLVFHSHSRPTKISMVEALRGKRGWLLLQLLRIDSFQTEEYLLFSGFSEDGAPLDQETCEKLFSCTASVERVGSLPEDVAYKLGADAQQYAATTVSRSLEQNNRFFLEEREKLEKWAEDMVQAAEIELLDTKNQIKQLNRQARQAPTVDDAHRLQKQIQELQKKQRRQRQRIFDVEDEIIEKRDALIEGLERRMRRQTNASPLFRIEWEVL